MNLFNPFKRKKYILISLLIVTIPERRIMLDALLEALVTQGIEVYLKRMGVNFEILYTPPEDYGLTIGAKRNKLLAAARGMYVAFIDDDDEVSPDYAAQLAAGVLTRPDVLSLTGEITTDGSNPRPFIHSLKYTAYEERGGVYYRPPNHLNCIRADLAKKIAFPEINYSEDTAWALALMRARLLKKEYTVPGTIYHYRYRTKNKNQLI